MTQNIFSFLQMLCSHPEALTILSIKSGKTVALYGVKALKIEEKDDRFSIYFFEDDVISPDELGFPYKKLKSSQTIRFELSAVSDLEKFRSVILTAFARCEENATFTYFGCCDLFIQCSDAQRCLRMDNPDFWGCLYRRHLEKGHIFYGKNKNYP